jgi:hypothetical protein
MRVLRPSASVRLRHAVPGAARGVRTGLPGRPDAAALAGLPPPLQALLMTPTARPVLAWTLQIAAAAAAFAGAILALIFLPYPFFSHHLREGAYDVWSDRPIPAAAAHTVLEDVTRRLARSPLWSPDQRFRVFICNDNWRLALYSYRFSGRMAGATDTIFSRNVYLRRSDFASNRLFPANPKADMTDRPLSYYLAHELTHVLESRAFGRAPAARYPHWLLEGYADYVGKGGRFDYAANLAALKAGAPELDWRRSGLYRVFHLETAYYLDRLHWTVPELFARKPDEAAALAAVHASGP